MFSNFRQAYRSITGARKTRTNPKDTAKKDSERNPFLKRLSSIFFKRRGGTRIGHDDAVKQPHQIDDTGPINVAENSIEHAHDNGLDIHQGENSMPKIVLETTKCPEILATSLAGDTILPDLMEKTYSYVTPDLTGQVVQTSAHPIFEGTYSNIFPGKWNGSKVAIKAIRRVDSLENMQRKLRREREVWGGLKHPNVVPLYGYCEEFGALGSLISPWYENGDVGTFVRERPTCALQRLQWLRNIIDGLVYLHSHDPIVIHGDLKPANALIDDEGRARLCDFGLVRVLSEGRKTGYTTGANHTGTVRYLSYELVKPEKPDEQVVSTTASDVHAIGCIALEIVFLQLPYATHQHVGHIYGDISKGVPPATELPWIGVPPPAVEDLWGMVVGCWNTDPTARPSAAQLQEYMQDHEDDLKEAFRQITTPALPHSTPNQ